MYLEARSDRCVHSCCCQARQQSGYKLLMHYMYIWLLC